MQHFIGMYIAAPPPLGSRSGGYNTAGCGGLRARALLPGRLLPTGRRFFASFQILRLVQDDRGGGRSSPSCCPLLQILRFAQNDGGRVAGPVRCAALRFRFFASLREILSEAMTGGKWRQGRQRRVGRDGRPGGGKRTRTCIR